MRRFFRQKCRAVLALSLAALSLLAAPVAATTLRAVVSDIDQTDPDWLALGTGPLPTMTFEFSFDETDPVTSSVDDTSYTYTTTRYRPTTFSTTVGGLSFGGVAPLVPNNVFLIRDAKAVGTQTLGDYVQLTLEASVPIVGNVSLAGLSIVLSSTGLGQVDDPLPSMGELSTFPNASGTLVFSVAGESINRALRGTTVTFTDITAPVPLPPTGAALLLGLAGLICLNRRRRVEVT